LRPRLHKEGCLATHRNQIAENRSVDYVDPNRRQQLALLDLTKHPCPLLHALRHSALGKSSEMTIHLDITEDVQHLPLWREKLFPHPMHSMKAHEGGHILAAIQLLDCQRCQDTAEKHAESGLARMSRVDECN